VRHRADLTQAEIVKALRYVGCQVFHIGRPCDLLVRRAGRLWLIDCDGVTKHRQRDRKQLEAFAQWGVVLVKTPQEALHAVAL